MQVSLGDGFSQADDDQRGEHVACAAEEAVDGWNVDLEQAGGEIGASGGADDGHGGGGVGELGGCDDDVGYTVGFVEFGYCFCEA